MPPHVLARGNGFALHGVSADALGIDSGNNIFILSLHVLGSKSIARTCICVNYANSSREKRTSGIGMAVHFTMQMDTDRHTWSSVRWKSESERE